MNTFIDKTTESSFFLSDLIGVKVMVQGKKVGKLDDLLIREYDKIPEVTHVIVSRPFGHKSLLVPFERVETLCHDKVVLDIPDITPFEGEPEETQVLLKDHVLDKKVIDLDDNEIDIVYDVKLVQSNRKLYATDVDFSRYALLKRLGLIPLAKLLFSGTDLLKKETLSWAYVQHLPEDLGSFKGNVKLNVLKEKLPEIHPVDLADILEELNEGQRLVIFNELETGFASDTLEEIEPRVQRSLISSMDKERVADLIDEMTPAQAADVLSILSAQDAEEILHLMEHEDAKKIELLLDQQDETIANLTTGQFIRFVPDMPADLVIAAYNKVSEDADVLDYIYVVDHDNRLQGVVCLPDLLRAKPPEAHLKEIMTADIISLNFNDTISTAKELFTRYGFRALPVIDDNDVILGVIPYRDIMNLEHRFV